MPLRSPVQKDGIASFEVLDYLGHWLSTAASFALIALTPHHSLMYFSWPSNIRRNTHNKCHGGVRDQTTAVGQVKKYPKALHLQRSARQECEFRFALALSDIQIPPRKTPLLETMTTAAGILQGDGQEAFDREPLDLRFLHCMSYSSYRGLYRGDLQCLLRGIQDKKGYSSNAISGLSKPEV